MSSESNIGNSSNDEVIAETGALLEPSSISLDNSLQREKQFHYDVGQSWMVRSLNASLLQDLPGISMGGGPSWSDMHRPNFIPYSERLTSPSDSALQCALQMCASVQSPQRRDACVYDAALVNDCKSWGEAALIAERSFKELHERCSRTFDVRLVGGDSGDRVSYGVLELCFNERWHPVCAEYGGNPNLAAAACRTLGFGLAREGWAGSYKPGIHLNSKHLECAPNASKVNNCLGALTSELESESCDSNTPMGMYQCMKQVSLSLTLTIIEKLYHQT
jgi:hypothetical protein